MAPKSKAAPPRAGKDKKAGEYDWSRFKFTPTGVLDMLTFHAADTIAIFCALLVVGYFYNVGASLCGIL